MLGRKIPIFHCLLPAHLPVLCKVETGTDVALLLCFPTHLPQSPLAEAGKPRSTSLAPPQLRVSSPVTRAGDKTSSTPQPASQHRETPGERNGGWWGQADVPRVASQKRVCAWGGVKGICTSLSPLRYRSSCRRLRIHRLILAVSAGCQACSAKQ